MPFFKQGINNQITSIDITDGELLLSKDFTDTSKEFNYENKIEKSTTEKLPTKKTKKYFEPIRRVIVKKERKKYSYKRENYHRNRSFIYNKFQTEKNDVNLNESTTIPETIKTLTFKLEPGNVVYIEDASCIYSAVHGVKKLKYQDMQFRSVDEGYQYHKLIDLCERPSTFSYMSKSNTHLQRNYVKRCLAECNKSRSDVIKWRKEKGMSILFDLTVQKFIQNPQLYKIMKDDKDKIILNIFGEDNYDGCGRIEDLQPWLQNNIHKIIEIPNTHDFSDLRIFPKISTGKNLQGVIIMLVRQHLEENEWC